MCRPSPDAPRVESPDRLLDTLRVQTAFTYEQTLGKRKCRCVCFFYYPANNDLHPPSSQRRCSSFAPSLTHAHHAGDDGGAQARRCQQLPLPPLIQAQARSPSHSSAQCSASTCRIHAERLGCSSAVPLCSADPSSPSTSPPLPSVPTRLGLQGSCRWPAVAPPSTNKCVFLG
jgi:hypothetical protein